MPPALRQRINTDFVIRLTYQNKPSQLVGAGQLHKHIGIDWAIKLSDEALRSKLQVYTRKLRRGVKIEFHSK